LGDGGELASGAGAGDSSELNGQEVGSGDPIGCVLPSTHRGWMLTPTFGETSSTDDQACGGDRG
jgi:hypothetical protein